MKTTTRILYLEDDPRDVDLLRTRLQDEGFDFELVVARKQADFEAATAQDQLDLILSDYDLPDYDGLSALTFAHQSRPEVPFLFLSGTLGEDRAVECLQLGAVDYIVKARPARLLPAIRRALAEARARQQQHQAKAALRESQERFRLVWSQSADGMCLTDAAGTIVMANPAYCRMVGLTMEAVEGNPMSDVYLEKNPSAILADDRANFAARAVQPHLETEVTLWNEKKVWLAVSNSYLETGKDQPLLLGIFRDVTERKRFEAQFLRAQRMESIGALASGIAHDLNNALAPIMMGGELLREQHPDKSEIVDLIQTSARRGADMVQQLLSFARGAEGERVSIQPRQLLSEMRNFMKGSFPKSIKLVVKSDPQLPTVLGDATQLHQVLLNLCVNARDAMPHGGVLTLEAQGVEVDAAYASSIPDAKPGSYVMLLVRDTGTGIPPEILDRILEPFFTTKGPDQGTGLGLSTALGIVKGHGGFLHICSQPGQGSTFAAYLPADRAGSDTERVTKAEMEFRGHGESILLVDDEPAVREMARAVLRRLNFKPLTAGDGAEGLIQAAEHRTELRAIVTDLHMPHLDGLGFVRALRRILPDIPIVVASGRMEDAVAGEFKSLGVTSRLNKPFTEVQLAEALRSLLVSK